MRLAVIVPNLPPKVCGVYDYTRKLHQHLGLADPWTLLCPSDGAPWARAKVIAVGRTARALSRALHDAAPTHIALQYTCFGYAQNGVPSWLADGLEEFGRTHDAPLAAMFHELAYDGPPWRRAFWRKRRQLELGQRIARMADCTLAAVPQWLDVLKNKRAGAAALAPVPSNIEPAETCRHVGDLTLGVFGLPGTREKALRAHARLLEQLMRAKARFALRIIGHGATQPSARESALVRRLALPSVERTEGEDEGLISRAIAGCHAMLTGAADSELYKSGTVAAAMAHGCAVVAPSRPHGGLPVLCGRTAELAQRLPAGEAKDAGLAARKWYEAHSGWARVAQVWRRALSGA